MTRFAKDRRVLFFEEPVAAPLHNEPKLAERVCPDSGVVILTPELPDDLQGEARISALRDLLDARLKSCAGDLIRWYYTPMMLPFSRHLNAACTVYDCMDELKNFKFAPPELGALEQELFAAADVVFTGGYSLWEAKKGVHPNVHPFPSSVDRDHFAKARSIGIDPGDQIRLGRPRLGFYGVVDERMDLDLLAAVADARPEWNLVILGPVVKIDPADLPRRDNIAYLGGKTYQQLPAYLSGWDVAMMPFAINESTKFISPTKTPEYLAGGRPVVSTSITDVVDPYLNLGLVRIADSAEDFARAIEEARTEDPQMRQARADRWLAQISWDRTWQQMDQLIEDAVASRSLERKAS